MNSYFNKAWYKVTAGKATALGYANGTQVTLPRDPNFIWDGCPPGRDYTGEVVRTARGVGVVVAWAMNQCTVQIVAPPRRTVPAGLPWMCTRCVEVMQPPATKCARCGGVEHALQAQQTMPSAMFTCDLDNVQFINCDSIAVVCGFHGALAHVLAVSDDQAQRGGCLMVGPEQFEYVAELENKRGAVRIRHARAPRAGELATPMSSVYGVTRDVGVILGKWPADTVAQYIAAVQRA